MCRLRWMSLSYSSFTENEGVLVKLTEPLQENRTKKGGFETMNKNLKKVISAVAALALSASSFVALAANYPDVDSSASYKQAVDELSALNILNGYEDGTFKPDELVTRAEFAKIVITTLGSAELNQANAAAGKDTVFTDVPGTHWASGYIAAAVSGGYINGMGDGTFAPDANVTYAQAMKMLICAAGYEQWSIEKGGWPSGYLYYANQNGVGNGVTGVTEDTEITRAQVAQMVDNVLTVPACVETNEFDYNYLTGVSKPKLEAKNGYGIEYQNILTKRHDAYKVKGTVTGTNKSTGGAVKADEVKFTVQVARNWLDQQDQISRSAGNAVEIKASIGNSGADEYLKKYVEAIIKETDDDEYEILSVALAGQNEEVAVAAEDFDYENSNYQGGNDYVGTGRLYFYSNGKTTSYKVDPEVELYVNGALWDGDINEGIDAYVADNSTSDVTLIDVPGDSNSTDGYYDIIMVDYYVTGIVDLADAYASDDITVNFLAIDDYSLAIWDIDLSDDAVSYTFTKNGEEISPADLEQYDVLSIKYDINYDIADSTFYDVIVTSDVTEGSYTLYNEADEEYTINGTIYKLNETTADALESGTTYTLYLDAFGRIAYTEEGTNSKKIAILDSVYAVYGGDSYDAKLIFVDGSYDTYELKDTGSNIDTAKKTVYVDGESGTKKDIQDRVVTYTINSNGEVTIKDTLTPYAIEDGEYKETQGRLGKITISNDATSFISGGDPTDVAGLSVSTLVDGNTYNGYAYDRSNDGVYRFVIITDAEGKANVSTKLAVYQKTYSTENNDGDIVAAYQVVIDGEVQTIPWESGYDAVSLTEGEAVLFDTNTSGEITNVHRLFGDAVISALASYDDVWNALVANDTTDLIAKAYVQSLTTSKLDSDLFFGAITDKGTNYIELGEVSVDEEGNVITDTLGDSTERLSHSVDGINVYIVDYNQKAGSRVSVSTASAITKLTIPSAAYLDSDKSVINWNAVSAQPRLALVKAVDGDASDIVVIIPKR